MNTLTYRGFVKTQPDYHHSFVEQIAEGLVLFEQKTSLRTSSFEMVVLIDAGGLTHHPCVSILEHGARLGLTTAQSITVRRSLIEALEFLANEPHRAKRALILGTDKLQDLSDENQQRSVYRIVQSSYGSDHLRIDEQLWMGWIREQLDDRMHQSERRFGRSERAVVGRLVESDFRSVADQFVCLALELNSSDSAASVAIWHHHALVQRALTEPQTLPPGRLRIETSVRSTIERRLMLMLTERLASDITVLVPGERCYDSSWSPSVSDLELLGESLEAATSSPSEDETFIICGGDALRDLGILRISHDH